MTMFWLLPQFLLLGLAQEIGKQSIANLCYAPLWWFFRSRSFCKYMQTVADAVSGVGYIGGMLSVCAVRKVKPSWFQYTLNRSRLDNYYRTLAAFAKHGLAHRGMQLIVENTGIADITTSVDGTTGNVL
ncbi:hypothetical protein ACFX15_009470 [Malus domestica]